MEAIINSVIAYPTWSSNKCFIIHYFLLCAYSLFVRSGAGGADATVSREAVLSHRSHRRSANPRCARYHMKKSLTSLWDKLEIVVIHRSIAPHPERPDEEAADEWTRLQLFFKHHGLILVSQLPERDVVLRPV